MVPHVHKVKVITDDEDSLGRWFKKDKPFPKEESSSVRNYMFNRLIPYPSNEVANYPHVISWQYSYRYTLITDGPRPRLVPGNPWNKNLLESGYVSLRLIQIEM